MTMASTTKRLGWVVVAFGLMVCVTAPAQAAGLYFRNRTGDTLKVAVMTWYRGDLTTNGPYWTVRGWYVIPAGQEIQTNNLIESRDFYYYAEKMRGGSISGP